MSSAKDSPGVVIPPPLIYAALFFLSLFIQKFLSLNRTFFQTAFAHILGAVIIFAALLFNVPALRQFIKTKNTLVTIKPANSLQTSGIYSVSRNPMYVSLLLLYTGIAFFVGNWWTIILLPFLALVINKFVIKPEERYLERAFGKRYLDYKKKVRRWL